MTAVIASTRFGPMLVPPYDTYVSQSLVRMGEFSPAEFETWRPYLPLGGIIVDVGANIGAHSLAFAAAVGCNGIVFAIEPQRALYYMLCGSIALANLMNVHARHCALSSEPGSIRVPTLDTSAPNNFGGLELRGAPAEAIHEVVAALPLDTMALQRLDFLKIDVEGMEIDVLRGAKDTIDRCRPVISAEADREQNTPALLQLLRLNGYRAWWHRPPLGALFGRVVSQNLLALPRERGELPAPTGDVEIAIE